VLLKDYRDLEGSFDKAVSIEMFEAVGLKHYDAYFGAVDRLLKPGGSFLIQPITMNERRFPEYIRSSDWIRRISSRNWTRTLASSALSGSSSSSTRGRVTSARASATRCC